MRVLSNRLPLKTFFAEIGINATSNCDTCGVRESLNHFLFNCSRFNKQRKSLKRKIRSRWQYFIEFFHFNPRTVIYGQRKVFGKNRCFDELNHELQADLWKLLCESVIETNRFPSLPNGRE